MKEFPVKICPDCRRVWQYYRNSSGKYNYEFLHDFPRYGLKEELCPTCVRKQNRRRLKIGTKVQYGRCKKWKRKNKRKKIWN
ncbi:MAG: hypothetical protein H0Z28_11115 [Archaeoglobus sp.]|nr:hypothetical protein [Archaeoglobus sp.]